MYIGVIAMQPSAIREMCWFYGQALIGSICQLLWQLHELCLLD